MLVDAVLARSWCQGKMSFKLKCVLMNLCAQTGHLHPQFNNLCIQIIIMLNNIVQSILKLNIQSSKVYFHDLFCAPLPFSSKI